MTLKEKFQKWHDSPTNETVAENIIELEKIADDYAIEFAEWVDENYCKINDTFVWIKSSELDFRFTYQTKELLEIFKKEKGL